MKGTIGFLFFMLFMAGFALINLQARQPDPGVVRPGDSPLTVNEWRPLRLFGNSVPGDADILVSFSGDGRMQGSAGCNRYSGRYEATPDAFRVASMRATRRQCDGEAMMLEQQLFDVFRDVRQTELADGDLRFLDGDGEWLATFTAADPVTQGGGAP